MMENIDPLPPEGVGNDGGINPPTIDNDTNPPSRRNRSNKYGISRKKRGGKSKRHQDTSIVAIFPAKLVARPEVYMAHDDLHGMPSDDTNIQMGLELTADKIK